MIRQARILAFAFLLTGAWQSPSAAAEAFRDRFLDGTGAGPEMEPLPGGPFVIGDVEGTGFAVPANPPRQVTLSPFAIAVGKTTNAEFLPFVNAHGNRMQNDDAIVRLGDGGNPGLVERQGKVTVAPGMEERPVTGVSWPAALAYGQWLSRKTGRLYTLPTAAQWEYAAAMSAPPRGAPDQPGADPAAKGVRGMMSDTWEWLLDCFELQFPLLAPKQDPALALADCPFPEIRGGGCGPGIPAARCRPDFRTDYFRSGHGTALGFRLVRLSDARDFPSGGMRP